MMTKAEAVFELTMREIARASSPLEPAELDEIRRLAGDVPPVEIIRASTAEPQRGQEPAAQLRFDL